jgi:hypothetical protein
VLPATISPRTGAGSKARSYFQMVVIGAAPAAKPR